MSTLGCWRAGNWFPWPAWARRDSAPVASLPLAPVRGTAPHHRGGLRTHPPRHPHHPSESPISNPAARRRRRQLRRPWAEPPPHDPPLTV